MAEVGASSGESLNLPGQDDSFFNQSPSLLGDKRAKRMAVTRSKACWLVFLASPTTAAETVAECSTVLQKKITAVDFLAPNLRKSYGKQTNKQTGKQLLNPFPL